VIIAPADYQRWLTGSEDHQEAARAHTGGMIISAVSDRVNDIS
jgi:hypothetical protein